jgi:GNAT superfamily N-acetyltransferase
VTRVVRAARARDAERLVALWSALLEHHRPLGPAWRVAAGAEDEWRALLARLLAEPDAALLVWEDENGVSGFCTAQIARAPGVAAERARCEITDLFVSKEMRRRGIGTALVACALRWCEERGVRRVEVRVAAENSEGQAFWRALGFGDFVDVLERRL